MNIKAFFVDALGGALELGIGTPDDVLRHVTPDLLAAHLPRPLWARLFTACLGAPKVDAQLVVETLGIPNLCEHIPSTVIWGCIAEIGARSLGKPVDTEAPVLLTKPTSTGRVLAPPPEERAHTAPTVPAPVAIGPSIPAPAPTPAANQPLADLITELETDDKQLANLRPRSPTAQRFRQSSTAVSRLGGGRRPQAAATPPPVARGTNPAVKRPGSEGAEVESETAVETADWRQKEIAVDDSQLVEWQTDSPTPATTAITGDDDFSDLGNRKR